jgi:transposase-like protein
MRGRAHSDEVRAQVMAALLAGQGIAEVARDYHLNEATVRNWKRKLPIGELTEVHAKKCERLEQLLFGYLEANLQALTRQMEIAGDPDYCRKQPAGELAVLHGVVADKALRLLEAAERAAANASLRAE